VFNFDGLNKNKNHSMLDGKPKLVKGHMNTKDQERLEQSKFTHQKLYGESLRRDTPITEKHQSEENDELGNTKTNFKMMPQRDRGPSKYFD
jgi:hypothetical protein